MTVDITVVVVTWNGRALLDSCLESLTRQTLAPDRYRILVVDNASSDGTVAHVRLRWPEVEVVESPRNVGFAGGCELALRHVRTRFVVLLNNDATAEPDLLERLLEAAGSAPDTTAAITAKVLLADRYVLVGQPQEGAVALADGRWARRACGTDRTDDLVDVVNSTGNQVRRDGRGEDRGWLTLDEDDAPVDVFGFCGAAALLDVAAVRAVGGFDRRYFLYYEDTDLSWRLRLAGHIVRYAPGAVARHAHASSSGEGSPLHTYYDERNRLLTLAKCAPAGMAGRVWLRAMVTTLSIARRELGHPVSTPVRLRALRDAVRLLPAALVERRRVSRMAVCSRRQVASLLVEPVARGRLRAAPQPRPNAR